MSTKRSSTSAWGWISNVSPSTISSMWASCSLASSAAVSDVATTSWFSLSLFCALVRLNGLVRFGGLVRRPGVQPPPLWLLPTSGQMSDDGAEEKNDTPRPRRIGASILAKVDAHVRVLGVRLDPLNGLLCGRDGGADSHRRQFYSPGNSLRRLTNSQSLRSSREGN